MDLFEDKNHKARLKRQYLRAPVRREALFYDDGNVLKAFCSNISTGGLLLSEMPIVPQINALPMMLDLPLYPDFSSCSTDRLSNLKMDSLERKILRVKARIVRSFQGQSEIDVIMSKKIGCEFVSVTDEDKESIKEYVSQYARNIIFLLNLFEAHRGSKEDQAKILRNLCQILGYTKETRIALLRQKILHDYQSLESL